MVTATCGAGDDDRESYLSRDLSEIDAESVAELMMLQRSEEHGLKSNAINRTRLFTPRTNPRPHLQ